mmetsp:Transcript_72049/g.211535  ORF Transcript_72049/g.211535 Transcript_72049/m.211535 type:complete len:202 (-) Transcript_72049:2-607(-)
MPAARAPAAAAARSLMFLDASGSAGAAAWLWRCPRGSLRSLSTAAASARPPGVSRSSSAKAYAKASSAQRSAALPPGKARPAGASSLIWALVTQGGRRLRIPGTQAAREVDPLAPPPQELGSRHTAATARVATFPPRPKGRTRRPCAGCAIRPRRPSVASNSSAASRPSRPSRILRLCLGQGPWHERRKSGEGTIGNPPLT